MNETEIEKYQQLIKKANMELDTLTFEEKEELYNSYDVQLTKATQLQKKFKKLAKSVDTAIIELEIERFLETGEIGDAQDVEYN